MDRRDWEALSSKVDELKQVVDEYVHLGVNLATSTEDGLKSHIEYLCGRILQSVNDGRLVHIEKR